MKKSITILMALFVVSLHLVAQTYSWEQIGTDFTGKTTFEYYGQSVSINADGSIIAIGADLFSPTNLTNAGRVQVYKNNNGTWQQLGSDIIGEATADQSGYSVSINADGTTVAIGAEYNDGNTPGSNCGHVRVYQFVAGSWVQIGQDIDGETSGDRSGNQVSLSPDGLVVAVNAQWNDNNGNNSGEVRIYKYTASSWTKIGNSIPGEAENDLIGTIDLNNDGSIVAIGTQFSEQGKGSVRVFMNQNNVWTQMGNNLMGKNSGDSFGYSVSLNSAGTILAVGAPNSDPNDLASAGSTYIFKYSENSWSQIGNNISGKTDSEYSGKVVSLNASGTIVAISATSFNSSQGAVRVYENTNNNWGQVADDISGKVSTDDNFGWSCSLSADGNYLAISTPYNDNNSFNAGYAQVYKKQDVTSIEDTNYSSASFFPNPVQSILSVSNLSNNSEICFFDVAGKMILKKHSILNTEQFDVSGFENGIYFIKINSEKNNYTFKMIKN